MRDWVNLLLGFACGVAVGIVLSSFFFGARLKFYKEYIEHRLTSINRLHFQGKTAGDKPRVSFWKALFNRTSRTDKGSKSIQD